MSTITTRGSPLPSLTTPSAPPLTASPPPVNPAGSTVVTTKTMRTTTAPAPVVSTRAVPVQGTTVQAVTTTHVVKPKNKTLKYILLAIGLIMFIIGISMLIYGWVKKYDYKIEKKDFLAIAIGLSVIGFILFIISLFL